MPDHDGQVTAPPGPGPLRWVEEFINTRSVQAGTDQIGTPALLANWLWHRDLLPAGVRVSIDEHHRALRMREGLRALAAASNAGPGSADHGPGSADHRPGSADHARVGSQPGRGLSVPALAEAAGLARRLPLVLDMASRPPRLTPLYRGTADSVLAMLLAAVAESVAGGTWNRLKACKDPGCRWAYYDQSRNRSRAWCSMAACGNRAKARAFRNRVR